MGVKRIGAPGPGAEETRRRAGWRSTTTSCSSIETIDAAADEDERLLDVVTSRRHFFIRQEAAKRIRDKRRLYPFEDDRHVGQILVRHLSRREDLTYLERISLLSRHVEVRKAAQVQLARVWRRLEGLRSRETQPVPKVSLAVAPGSGRSRPASNAAGVRPRRRRAEATSAPLEGNEVDGSLLGWAALPHRAGLEPRNAATKDPARSHARLSPRRDALALPCRKTPG
jgi:hypothetical protein